MPAGILLTTAYFPPPEYFVSASAAEKALIERHENYKKQTYRNRCRILTANGPLSLVIPVKRFRGRKTSINEIKPDYSYKWQRLHRISIDSAYRSAPFYEYYIDDIIPFFELKFDYLIDLNSAILEKMLEVMNLRVSWEYTNSFMEQPPPGFIDVRESIHPKRNIPETARIAESMNYIQVFQEKWGFIPGLSILDLLFNTGPDAAVLLKNAAAELKS